MLTEEPCLSGAQQRAIPALLSNRTLVDAARESRVSKRTIDRRLAHDLTRISHKAPTARHQGQLDRSSSRGRFDPPSTTPIEASKPKTS